jgi:hypothetical protein
MTARLAQENQRYELTSTRRALRRTLKNQQPRQKPNLLARPPPVGLALEFASEPAARARGMRGHLFSTGGKNNPALLRRNVHHYKRCPRFVSFFADGT